MEVQEEGISGTKIKFAQQNGKKFTLFKTFFLIQRVVYHPESGFHVIIYIYIYINQSYKKVVYIKVLFFFLEKVKYKHRDEFFLEWERFLFVYFKCHYSLFIEVGCKNLFYNSFAI